MCCCELVCVFSLPSSHSELMGRICIRLIIPGAILFKYRVGVAHASFIISPDCPGVLTQARLALLRSTLILHLELELIRFLGHSLLFLAHTRKLLLGRQNGR